MDGISSTFLRDLLPAQVPGRGDLDLALLDAEDLAALTGGEDAIPFVVRPRGGILYVEDFDAPIAGSRPPGDGASPAATKNADTPEAAVVASTFSAADLAAVHEAGRLAGEAAARLTDAATYAELRLSALQAIADGLATTRSQALAIAHQAAEATTRTLLAMLQAALPALSAAHAPVEIAGIMDAILPGLRREPALSLRLHPDMLAFVADELAQSWPDIASKATLTADCLLAPADVTIAWGDSRAVRCSRDVWDQIRAALASFALPGLPINNEELTDDQ